MGHVEAFYRKLGLFRRTSPPIFHHARSSQLRLLVVVFTASWKLYPLCHQVQHQICRFWEFEIQHSAVHQSNGGSSWTATTRSLAKAVWTADSSLFSIEEKWNAWNLLETCPFFKDFLCWSCVQCWKLVHLQKYMPSDKIMWSQITARNWRVWHPCFCLWLATTNVDTDIGTVVQGKKNSSVFSLRCAIL